MRYCFGSCLGLAIRQPRQSVTRRIKGVRGAPCGFSLGRWENVGLSRPHWLCDLVLVVPLHGARSGAVAAPAKHAHGAPLSSVHRDDRRNASARCTADVDPPAHSCLYDSWECTLPLVLLSQIAAAVECYCAIAALYLKIGRFAVTIFSVALLAGLLSTGKLPFEMPRLVLQPITHTLLLLYGSINGLLCGGSSRYSLSNPVPVTTAASAAHPRSPVAAAYRLLRNLRRRQFPADCTDHVHRGHSDVDGVLALFRLVHRAREERAA